MFYELIKLLLPHVGGLTEDAVKEFEAAIEQHQAEHEAAAANVVKDAGPAPGTEGVTP